MSCIDVLNRTWAEKLNLVIAKASRVIQARQFVRALPQLVSRIMHSNRASCELLHFIFSKIFAQYPHPVIWALIVVVKSSVASRQKRGLELLLKLRKDPSYGHLCKVNFKSFHIYASDRNTLILPMC